jgi:hypothetical protein
MHSKASPTNTNQHTKNLNHQVEEVFDGTDCVCVAQNDALLDGLLTVFHVERSK